MKLFFKITLTSILILSLIYYNGVILLAEGDDEVYVPYPVVFVHGINADNSTWDTAKGALDEYYRKYEYVGSGFSFANYGRDSNRSIPSLTGYLTIAISKAMQCFPSGYRGEKKAVIVSHSMGGIITRLVNSSKAHKTVFIGVPNRGAPIASAIVFLNNIRNRLPTIISKYSSFWGIVAGSKFRFTVNPLPVNYYLTILYKLLGRLASINFVLGQVSWWVNPNGITIRQLALPEDVSYEETLSGFNWIWYVSENLFDKIEGGNAFLNNPLPIPSNRRVIRGGGDIVGGIIGFFINYILNEYNNILEFSIQNLETARNQGDGIVTLYSQSYGIGGSNVKTYQIQASHIEETKQWQTILQAIDDDPPEVVRIYAVPKNWLPKDQEEAEEYYIIVGCKEYLLADVEVVELTLNGEDINLFPEGKPYNTNTYGRNFLRGRQVAEIKDVAGVPMTLRPGEFYVLTRIPVGKSVLRVRLRNPAQVLKGEAGAKPVVVQFSRPVVEDVDFLNNNGLEEHNGEVDVPPYDEEVEPHYNVVGNYGNFTFSVESALFRDILLDVEIRNVTTSSGGVQIGGILRRLLSNRAARLGSGMGNVYWDDFPSNSVSTEELTWDGSNNAGGFLPQYRDSLVRIVVRSQNRSGMSPPFNPNNNSGRQGLYGSNWDDGIGIWNDFVYTDPTYVQYPRELDIPLGLELKLDVLGKRLGAETDNLNNNSIKTYLEGQLIPLLESLVCVEEGYLRAREILMRSRIELKIGEYIVKLLSYKRQIELNRVKKGLEAIFHGIGEYIPSFFIGEVDFHLKYRHSPSSTPIQIDIKQENN